MNKLEELKILADQTREYLQVGGLFNPELMEHDKVRDMILRLSELLPDLIAAAEAAKKIDWPNVCVKNYEERHLVNVLQDALLSLTKGTDK